MMLLALIPAALAHGTSFGTAAIAPAPDDPDTIWAVVEGWGVVRTRDSGATWGWICEETLASGGDDAPSVLSLLARPAPSSDPGLARAWVGTRTGLLAVDDSCGARVIPGLPERAYVASMLLGDDGDSVEVLATGPVAGGVYRCDDEGCAASGLARDGLFPKSIVRDGGVRWVSTVDADTLAARLFRSADGARWEEVRPPAGGALWPEGDVDVRMLHARGEVLLAWARTRVDGDTPRLLRSEDAGRSWGAVLSYGSWQDAAAALSVAGDGSLLLGSYRGARTWRSRDGGRTWEDASAELPAVRCAASGPDGEGGTRAYVCADHLADGLDVAAEVEGVWTPVGCLEQAEPAACAQDACGPFMELYAAASAASGESTCAEAPVAKEPCGCASGSSAGALGVLAAFGLLLQRRRERPRP